MRDKEIYGVFDGVNTHLLLDHKDTMLRWAKALASGKYKQGKFKLREDNSHFCPLGVLCDVCDPKGWLSVGTLFSYRGSNSEVTKIPVTEILETGVPGTSHTVESHIARLNDTGLMLFNDLALEIWRVYAEIDAAEGKNVGDVVYSTTYHLGIPPTKELGTEEKRLVSDAWEDAFALIGGELLGVTFFEEAVLITCSFPPHYSIEFVADLLKTRAIHHNLWRNPGYMASTGTNNPVGALRAYIQTINNKT